MQDLSLWSEGSVAVALRLSCLWHVDLSSLIRDQPCVPCIGRWILNYWHHQGNSPNWLILALALC